MHQPITHKIAKGMIWDITHNGYDYHTDEHVKNAILALLDDINKLSGCDKRCYHNPFDYDTDS